jgi:[NiFe] hydrogenase assembly HybE family chaperone
MVSATAQVLGPRPHATSPAAPLVAAFTRIERERMAGMAMLNPRLQVEAIGWRRWQGHWLGALLSPWFLNLVLVPGGHDGWTPAADGERVFHRFPAGDFAFLGNREPELGEFQSCSLYSPVDLFETQQAGRETALAALQMLLAPPQPVPAPGSATGCGGQAAAAAPAEVPIAVPPQWSKRRFLIGRRTA